MVSGPFVPAPTLCKVKPLDVTSVKSAARGPSEGEERKEKGEKRYMAAPGDKKMHPQNVAFSLLYKNGLRCL